MPQVIITKQHNDKQSPYALEIQLNETLAIGPEEAQQCVKQDLIPKMGTGLTAHEPELIVQDEQIIWRVPIVLSLPTVGTLGTVGTVSVDARSGDLLLTQDQQQEIIDHARRLYKGSVL